MRTEGQIPCFLLFPLIGSMFLVSTGVDAQSNMVLLISPPGDYIGQGQTYYATNHAEFGLTGSAATVRITAFGFILNIDAPGDSNLVVASYTNAYSYPANGASPGLSIGGNGRSCISTSRGDFEIREIATDAGGQVVRFWATFLHRCGNNPPLTGEIRYNSLLAPPTPLSRTLRVPGDFPTIQAALDNANVLAVDIVRVAPGIYIESIQFGGKRAHLLSAEGPTATYLVASPESAAVTFAGATPESLLCGFTIRDSTTAVSISHGGSPTIVSNAIVNCQAGIVCNGGSGSPIIRDNAIIACPGGAIHLLFTGSPLVEGNLVENNGGGIGMNQAGAPIIRNNVIRRNWGDGIGMSNGSDANVVQNLIVENGGHGIYWLVPFGNRGPWVANNTILENGGFGISANGYDAGAWIVNNILSGNPALAVAGSYDNSPPIIEYNNIYSSTGEAYSGLVTNLTGVDGNISADPFFRCQPNDDLRLLPDSPCIDAGTNATGLLPTTDFDGGARILAGHTNSPMLVDIGAFEFNPSTPAVPCLFLYCPPNIVVPISPDENSAVVNYPVPFATPGANVTSIPPSGSRFPAGTNTVTVTAIYGAETLECIFTVSIVVAPSITSQPLSTTVPAGTMAELSLTAQGSSPLHYQWTFEEAQIASATNATLMIPNPQAEQEGYYRVIVTNFAGSVTSAPTVLRVLPAGPDVIAEPSSQTVSAGSDVAFEVGTRGSTPLWFYWYRDGIPFLATTSSQLIITNAQAGDSGSYQAIVSNVLGTASSSAATLGVLPAAPAFTLHPADGSLPYGTNVTLTALARGTEDIFYQWQRERIVIPGATGPVLILSNVNNSAGGFYRVIATNAVGSATSREARINIFGSPPIFVEYPTSVEVLEGSTVTLRSRATGTAPLQYEWYFQGIPLMSRTNRQLLLTPVTMAEAGLYFVTASNSFGMATSTVAQVTVNQSLVLQRPLSNYVARAGGTVVMAIEASGSGMLAYTWRFNSTLLATTEPILALTNVQPPMSGYYRVTVSNEYGSISSLGRLSVFGQPSWVVAWGDNSGSQTNVPVNLGDAVAGAGGDYHSITLRQDGTLLAWGYNGDGQINVPRADLRFVSVAAGAAHNLAILEDGSLVAWGRNDHGQIDVPTSATNVLALAAGGSHSLALLSSGIVLAWGDNSFGQTSVPQGLTDIAQIVAGRNHNLAVRQNGTVAGWGFNSHGQASAPPSLSSVAAVAAGYLHSLALRSNGTVVVWGDNTYGQTNMPAGMSNVVAVAAGDFHTLALHADGSVYGWGDGWFGQTNVPSTVAGATSVASGYYHGLALVQVPLLHLNHEMGGVVVEWSGPGVLQWAPTPVGAYTDIPGSSQSYTNTDMSVPAKFFRLRR